MLISRNKYVLETCLVSNGHEALQYNFILLVLITDDQYVLLLLAIVVLTQIVNLSVLLNFTEVHRHLNRKGISGES